MVNSLDIIFESNSSGIYYPNQNVSLLIELKVDKPIKKAKGLRIIVSGIAKSEWNESQATHRRNIAHHFSKGSHTGISRYTTGNEHHVIYIGEEKLFMLSQYLLGSKSGPDIEIAQGVHSFRFEHQLPPDIPCSAEGHLGFVRYTVDVNLDISWAIDLNKKVAFSVSRNEDLNLIPELAVPCEVEKIKTFCCWFCKSNPITFKACISKTGYALGEQIYVTIELNNTSARNITKTLIIFRRVDKFISQYPVEITKTYKRVILEIEGRGANAGADIKFDESILVPHDLSLSSDRTCKVFQITYELKLIAKANGLSLSPTLKIPITIGSIGIRGNRSDKVRKPSSGAKYLNVSSLERY